MCSICYCAMLQESPQCDQCKQSICIDCYAMCEACPFCRLSNLNWFHKLLRCKNPSQVQRMLQLYFERESESQNKFSEIANRFFDGGSPDCIRMNSDLIRSTDSDEDILDVLHVCRDWLFYCAENVKSEEQILDGIALIEELREHIASTSIAESFILDIDQLFEILDQDFTEERVARKIMLRQTWEMQKMQLKDHRRRSKSSRPSLHPQARQMNRQRHKSRNGIRRL